MKINVSSKNEYYFYPDVADNLKKEEKDRFTIVVQRINIAIEGDRLYKYDKDYKYLGVDNVYKIKRQIKEIKNPPKLELEDGTEKELTLEDLVSDKHPELFSILGALNSFLIKLDSEGVETKKS